MTASTRAPFPFHLSPSPYARPSFIDISRIPRSPGLLLRLHSVSMPSVLPFRTFTGVWCVYNLARLSA